MDEIPKPSKLVYLEFTPKCSDAYPRLMLKLLNWAINLMRVQNMKSLVFPAFNLSRNISNTAFLIIFQNILVKRGHIGKTWCVLKKVGANLDQDQLLYDWTHWDFNWKGIGNVLQNQKVHWWGNVKEKKEETYLQIQTRTQSRDLGKCLCFQKEGLKNCPQTIKIFTVNVQGFSCLISACSYFFSSS